MRWLCHRTGRLPVFPFLRISTMVRKGGFEPPRLSAPPPQDGVSASSTTSALKSPAWANFGELASDAFLIFYTRCLAGVQVDGQRAKRRSLLDLVVVRI